MDDEGAQSRHVAYCHMKVEGLVESQLGLPHGVKPLTVPRHQACSRKQANISRYKKMEVSEMVVINRNHCTIPTHSFPCVEASSKRNRLTEIVEQWVVQLSCCLSLKLCGMNRCVF